MSTNVKSLRPANNNGFRAFNSLLLTVITLSGCYVEVGPYPSAYYDTEVNYNTDITDFSTDYLVLTALTPLALGMEAPEMIADPDDYTEPRSAQRAVVTETTYSYLYDDWYCSGGGYTEIEAEADTTSYSDGFTYVDIQLASESRNCTGWSNGTAYTVNSSLFYDVYGWYDDWDNQIDSVNGTLSGELVTSFSGKAIDYSRLSVSVNDISATDYALSVNADLSLDYDWDFETASLVTSQTVHWYRFDSHPHQGKVRISNGQGWVTLTFDSYGVWRDDSAYHASYYSWYELGY